MKAFGSGKRINNTPWFPASRHLALTPSTYPYPSFFQKVQLLSPAPLPFLPPFFPLFFLSVFLSLSFLFLRFFLFPSPISFSLSFWLLLFRQSQLLSVSDSTGRTIFRRQWPSTPSLSWGSHKPSLGFRGADTDVFSKTKHSAVTHFQQSNQLQAPISTVSCCQNWFLWQRLSAILFQEYACK